MKVTLLSHTPNPEQVVAAAARLCYSSSDIDDIIKGMADKDKVAPFVKMLAEMGHESPIEHASFTFGVEGVSRSLLAQLTRHRIASYSVQSQRYVKEAQFEYVIPPEIESIPEAKEVYIETMKKDQEAYEKLTDILFKKHKDILLNEGINEKVANREAEKQAIEDARFVLPNACTTKLVMSMNARSLNNFFSLRCCNRAQWEIRNLADKMLKLCYEASPELFVNSGPGCLRGPCPEGKMTCGKITKVRERYKSMKNQ